MVTTEVTFGVRYVLTDVAQNGAELVMRLKRTDTNAVLFSSRVSANTTWPAPPADFAVTFAVSHGDIVSGVECVLSIPSLENGVGSARAAVKAARPMPAAGVFSCCLRFHESGTANDPCTENRIRVTTNLVF